MVVLYQNGILEPTKAKGLFFNERELIDLFKEYDSIKSVRVLEVPNTWCIWGVNKKNNESDYHSLATYMFATDIYSHIVFIHDTELNPELKLADEIIYKSYDQFIGDLMNYLNNMSLELVEANNANKSDEEKNQAQIYLDNIGKTADNKVLFGFDMDAQSKEFYDQGSFNIFSERVVNYLMDNYKRGKPLVILEDKHISIVLEGKSMSTFFDNIIDQYIKTEKYEVCKKLTDIKNQTLGIKKPKKERKTKKEPK